MRPFLLLLAGLALGGCSSKSPAAATPPPSPTGAAREELPLLPRPRAARVLGGELRLAPGDALLVQSDPAWTTEARRLAAALEARGVSCRFDAPASGASVPLVLAKDDAIVHPEGYVLDVEEHGVTLRARTEAGMFYAAHSLLQLVDAAAEPARARGIRLPTLVVEDEPRFSYRGLMLDVSRHFFPVAFVERVLDEMARYKLNTFHFHLVDDQGWRLEIERYPRLTEVGATRPETQVGHARHDPPRFDGTPHRGFYTQAEIRHLVAYAAERHITVVPEIELPGHSRAALAAYPELGCHEGPYEVATTWGIFDEVYCPGEATFRFLEGVFDEVVALFPGPFVHLGGDEVHKKEWLESPRAQSFMKARGLKDPEELQSHFVGHFVRYLEKHGKRAIGWDEILEGGLPEGALVMSWRGEEGAVAAARAGHDVILVPNRSLYFDQYQSRPVDAEPLAIGGYLPLEAVYAYDPIPDALEPPFRHHVLGAQANLWTEYVSTTEHAEYLLFPRVLALAELTWTPRARKSWPDFRRRALTELERLEARGLRPATHLFAVEQHTRAEGGRLFVELTSPSLSVGASPDADAGADAPRTVSSDASGAPLAASSATSERAVIVYTTDGSEPDERSPRYTGVLELDASRTLSARTVRPGGRLSLARSERYWVGSSTGLLPSASTPPDERYAQLAALTDGALGSLHFNDGRWVGWNGEGFTLVFDRGAPRPLAAARVRLLSDLASWIAFPRALTVELSVDGRDFEALDAPPLPPDSAHARFHELTIELGGRPARFVRLRAEPLEGLPPDHPGAGKPAWIFLDEIVLEAAD